MNFQEFFASLERVLTASPVQVGLALRLSAQEVVAASAERTSSFEEACELNQAYTEKLKAFTGRLQRLFSDIGKNDLYLTGYASPLTQVADSLSSQVYRLNNKSQLIRYFLTRELR